ncbi:MAG: hypothetical protein LBM99_00265 [Bacillales bacterium]|nr:hypothetical protein [Bacillales bacterium]
MKDYTQFELNAEITSVLKKAKAFAKFVILLYQTNKNEIEIPLMTLEKLLDSKINNFFSTPLDYNNVIFSGSTNIFESFNLLLKEFQSNIFSINNGYELISNDNYLYIFKRKETKEDISFFI